MSVTSFSCFFIFCLSSLNDVLHPHNPLSQRLACSFFYIVSLLFILYPHQHQYLLEKDILYYQGRKQVRRDPLSKVKRESLYLTKYIKNFAQYFRQIRVAQRKRGGPITHRSQDRNLALIMSGFRFFFILFFLF